MGNLTDNVSFLKKLSNSKITHKIKKIDLSDNSITTLPDALDFFPEKMHATVTEITFSSNKLKTVPLCLSVFTNLKKLDLYSNSIQTLPIDVFGKFSKLK